MRNRTTARYLLVALPVVVAVLVGVILFARESDGEKARVDRAVDLQATDAVAVASLDDLVAAADCVATGEVIRTDEGRAIGSGLLSRLVTVRVDDAVAGDCPTGTVVVEEEGWLADGTEVTVNGWVGSAVGDRGVWFLDAGISDELPYASTVSTNGALRWRGDVALVPDRAPAWAKAATTGGLDQLVTQLSGARH